MYLLSHTLIIQDLQTKEVLAIGKVLGRLYLLEPDSLSTKLHQSSIYVHSVSKPTNYVLIPCNVSLDTWHKCLGNASYFIL